jgi:hypothetical protein
VGFANDLANLNGQETDSVAAVVTGGIPHERFFLELPDSYTV